MMHTMHLGTFDVAEHFSTEIVLFPYFTTCNRMESLNISKFQTHPFLCHPNDPDG
jgi:hypothetical protein